MCVRETETETETERQKMTEKREFDRFASMK